MSRALVCLYVLASCREVGTIEIERNPKFATCEESTTVSVEVIPDGECGACNCDGGCPVCAPPSCIQLCEAGCALDAGIEFDPPGAGSYAIVLRYTSTNPAPDASIDRQTAVVCIKVEVDADGSQSRTVEAAPDNTDCCTR